MGVNRYAAKRDNCEAGIVWALRKAGCTVHHISGKGISDLVVSAPWCPGVNYLLECKEAHKGELTPAQKTFRASWHGQHAIVSEPMEALLAVETSSHNIIATMTAYGMELEKPVTRRFKK